MSEAEIPHTCLNPFIAKRSALLLLFLIKNVLKVRLTPSLLCIHEHYVPSSNM